MNDEASFSSASDSAHAVNNDGRSCNFWPEVVRLSDREVETLTWAARGKTLADIALILGLSKRTVDFHIDNARSKLCVATRIEAAVKATIERLIEP